VSGGPSDDLRELVGADVPQDELARLAEADAALRATPAPPEASETLAKRVLAISGHRRRGVDRRRALAGLAIAAAFAGAAFGIGLWAGGNGGGPTFVEEVTLAATANAPEAAEMTLSVLEIDEAGNWRMSGDVTGLPPLADDHYYEVWLTKGDELVEPCGRFVVGEDGRADNVWFTAPYKFSEFDRWVAVEVGPDGTTSDWLLDGPVTQRDAA
jgi:Anti-sigma-K factor rskA